ncbi:22e009ab-eeb5-4402-92ce-d8c79e3f523f [Thermothielavioides terrestris]|uniref:22e009ab-eeb5-4402-92ce-d8c79e3f523f n=1 Tax=Thermothielavioides terrestris TaxID=2587410 RepID=A0A3S5CXS1_9PEZI|nr:22e009ab-eeb5-4402-92ce-d8c79e3f523f [Thermothielavioides terrestris]
MPFIKLSPASRRLVSSSETLKNDPSGRVSGGLLAVILVATAPATTESTRTPYGRSSSRSASLYCSIAAFEAA